MNLKIWTLPLIMGVLLSSIYFLPEGGEMASSAIRMKLPEEQGGWDFRNMPPSRDEVELLADDTEFSKAICLNPRLGEYDSESGMQIPDRIDLSVVLSGHDLNNSIHRPERCMPSQGHVIGSSSTVSLELPNGRKISARRLLSVQSIPANEERTEFSNFQSVTYYFFVGHQSTTEDHLKRTLIDMKDRLIYGMDQHWAYVSATMWYGDVPWIGPEVSLAEADEKMQQFLVKFSTEQIDWSQIKE